MIQIQDIWFSGKKYWIEIRKVLRAYYWFFKGLDRPWYSCVEWLFSNGLAQQGCQTQNSGSYKFINIRNMKYWSSTWYNFIMNALIRNACMHSTTLILILDGCHQFNASLHPSSWKSGNRVSGKMYSSGFIQYRTLWVCYQSY